MPYIAVENLSQGVDRRRPIYASKQGSLWEGINGHLSRGGDFEKRKAFVSTFSLPAGRTFGLQNTGTDIVVFGDTSSPPEGIPSGVNYQGLVHPKGEVMSEILWTELYDGKIYAIAKYADDSVIHFYNGTIVHDWINGTVQEWMTTNNDIANYFKQQVNDTLNGYSATVSGGVLTITGPVGTNYAISASAENGGDTDDQAISINQTQSATSASGEVLATGSFDVTRALNSYTINSHYGAGYFVEFTDVSVTVDGVHVMPVNTRIVGPKTTTEIASAIASAINGRTSSPNYSASSSGNTVTIKAKPGTGTGPNGFVVSPSSQAPTSGGGYAGVALTYDNTSNMSGGSAGTPDQEEINEVTFSGTVETGDKFTLTVAGERMGYDADNPIFVGNIVMTEGDKIYAAAASLLNFSGVAAPTGWNSTDDTGAGFINMSNHDEGSATLTGLGKFLDYIAVFSRTVIQLWSVASDPDDNSQVQVVRRTGTRSPGSIQSFGTNDLFYLYSTGVRSLRERFSNLRAGVSDVGTLIDTVVQEWMDAMTDDEIEKIRSIIEPEASRYWLAFKDKVAVFSYFPDSKISGWTWYELDFDVDWFADPGDNTGPYVRSGDTIYKYGGSDNNTYDSSMVTCWMPFMDADRPGTFKDWVGLDIFSKNAWDVDLLNDPNELSRRVEMGELSNVTVQEMDFGVIAHCPSLSPKLTCTEAGEASISGLVLYYNMAETEDDT